VDTARCFGPESSRKECNSAGRDPLNKRSQAAEPMPVTQARPADGVRNPTDLSSAATSASRSRTIASPPGLMVTTRKIAAALSGVSTGCGIGWVMGLLQAPVSGLLRTASRRL
jgi:hypothetical protein